MMTLPSPLVAQGATLNYVVTGDHRSGVAVVQSCLDQTPAVVCHGDLFFDEYGDVAYQDRTRRAAHERYFGAAADDEVGKFPEWFAPGDGANPCRYLNDRVFDNPRAGEDHVGVRLLYHQIARYELFDLLNERWREGDFCLVHVVRNPVACLVSKLQAERSGLWRQHASSPAALASPPPVYLDLAELVQAVRLHEAVKGKIRVCCPDALEVPYRELVFNYQKTMERVFEFLEVPPQVVPQPLWQRLRNHDLRRRILNFDRLRAALAPGLRHHLEGDLC